MRLGKSLVVKLLRSFVKSLQRPRVDVFTIGRRSNWSTRSTNSEQYLCCCGTGEMSWQGYENNGLGQSTLIARLLLGH